MDFMHILGQKEAIWNIFSVSTGGHGVLENRIQALSRTFRYRFKDFQGPCLFSRTFQALKIWKKIWGLLWTHKSPVYRWVIPLWCCLTLSTHMKNIPRSDSELTDYKHIHCECHDYRHIQLVNQTLPLHKQITDQRYISQNIFRGEVHIWVRHTVAMEMES